MQVNKKMPSKTVRDQTIASIIDVLNAERISNEFQSINTQDAAFIAGLRQIDNVKEFISCPEHILGRLTTKHGEIAEVLEVGIRRAEDALNQSPFSASFEGVHRTGPVDYTINGVDVQSKYLNGSRNTINAIREHSDTYNSFVANDGYYHVPKDQYSQMEQIMNGKVPDGLSEASAIKIKAKLDDFLSKSGKPLEEVIKPGSNNYADVQINKAPEAVSTAESNLHEANEAKKAAIHAAHQPSIEEAGKYALIGAGVAATLNFGLWLYKKHKAGKSLSELTEDDWKELGLQTLKSAKGAAVSSLSIYTLTNYCSLSAPLAGAFTSATIGIASQIHLYKQGKLTSAQLKENCVALAAETAIVSVGAAAGQALIPIPVLGAIIGSVVGKFVSKTLTDYMGKKAKKLAESLLKKAEICDQLIKDKYDNLSEECNWIFELGSKYISNSFDYLLNYETAKLAFESIKTARLLGVPSEHIIKSRPALDKYMLE